MRKLSDLRFSPGNDGILFIHDTGRETNARCEIQRLLRSFKYTETVHPEKSSRQDNANSTSFLLDLEEELGAMVTNSRAPACPREERFVSCISKVNGYLPYFFTSSEKDMPLKIATILWKFFDINCSKSNEIIVPRYIRKAIPFSHSCWSDAEYIAKESAKVIHEGISVFRELRMDDIDEIDNVSKIYFAVQVHIRAHTTLQTMKSTIKCRFLKDCWRASDQLEYNEAIIDGDWNRGEGKGTPGCILFHITILSQATFMGYIFDPMNGYGFKRNGRQGMNN